MTTIREESPADTDAIRRLIGQAFATARFSSGTEGAIVDALRGTGQLSLSLVAEAGGDVAGHVAFSPVRVGDGSPGWFALGPLSVAPDRQRGGIGAALVREGVRGLADQGAAGIVLLGDPAYYGRFGFVADPRVRYPAAPAEYLLVRSLDGFCPRGEVRFDPAFSAV